MFFGFKTADFLHNSKKSAEAVEIFYKVCYNDK